MHLLRYLIIKYSLLRQNSFLFYNKNKLTNDILIDKTGNKLFEEINTDLDIEKSKFTIYPIKFAIIHNKHVTILGILINNGEGQILIEDPSQRVKIVIDSNKTLFGKGIYCYNHIVIARGKMNKMTQSFHVDLMFHPPIQNIDENTTNVILTKLFPDLNIPPMTTENAEKSSTRKQITTEIKYLDPRMKVQVTKNEYWVIISDILLTSTKVIENLRKVFSGYEKMVLGTDTQIGFILLGNFTNIEIEESEENFADRNTCVEDDSFSFVLNEKEPFVNPNNEFSRETYLGNSRLNFRSTKESFEKLKDIFREFPILLSKCNFFIISGPNDIGPNLLPKNPLSNYYTSNLSKVFPDSKIYFLSNPSTLDDGQIQMFFSRHSLTKELKEKTLFSYFGTKNIGLPTQWNIEPEVLKVVIPQTVLGQQHLSPTSSNIIPSLDNFLYLLPTPDILIIADSGPSFSVKSIDKIWIVNPGSFYNTNSWVQFNVLNNSIDHVWL